MRRLGIAAAVSALALLGASLTATQERALTAATHLRLTLAELEEWAGAVASHEPGLVDPAAVRIARWPPQRLYVLFTELRTLEAFRENPRVKKGPADNQDYPAPGLPPYVIRGTLELTTAEVKTGNVNRILHRAALLHTDIALLVRGVASAPTGSPFTGRMTMDTEDGRQTRLSGVSAHLEFASWLLDGVRPDPSGDERVRAWYQSVAAILQRARHTGDADWLLRRALAIFPSDALTLFYSGVVHETLAMPRIQAAKRAAIPASGFTVGGSSERQELERAAAFFRRAIDVSPEFAEARLHQGRVQALLGRHESAAVMLTDAAAGLTDATLQYYAALFLGREQDVLGSRDEARDSFTRAAALFPRAQSALLAGSELARRTGDAAGARAPLERLFALPANDLARDDPWWWYDVSHVLNADALLSAWRATVRSGMTP